MTAAVAPAEGAVRALARPALRRPRSCAVTGVSAGLAEHLGWPVGVVRIVFAALVLLSGAGLLLYVWLWIMVPWADAAPDASAEASAPTRGVPVAWLSASAAAVGLVGTVVLEAGSSGLTTVLWGDTSAWLAGMAITTVLAVCAGLWATLVDRADPTRGPRHELSVRIVVTAVLGVLWIAQLPMLQRGGVIVFFAALLPLAGIAAVFSSTLVGRWRELSRERVRRIREEQRSEMAAHLHDSVLQTLALIQNRAGASSEVARLARAQERELRSWLYDGDAPADSDLPTDLRDFAAALEIDYPVHIEVVAAGTSTERASGEVAAAAREAMLNAARHAGGEVSVYIEGTASAVDVYVRDRGPGFDPDAVPDDRLGVRESIVGRMRRAGGTATVRPGAGGAGTEVHLHVDGRAGGPGGGMA